MFDVNNPQPSISSISPANVVAGSGPLTLTVNGNGFVNGSVVNWSGSALSTRLVSGTQLSAALPGGDVAGSAADLVTVTNPAPGGGTTGGTPVTVNSPTPGISSISPQTVAAGAAATITLTGSGFESNSVVLWNGSPRPTTFVSSSTLQVSLSALDLQQSSEGQLAVSNPGPGGSTSSVVFLAVTSQPIPAISAVDIELTNPNGVCPQLSVTVTGSNFTPYSSIQANGVALPQVFQGSGGSTSIYNLLPEGFVSKSGALAFTVTNPGTPPATSAPFVYPASSPTLLGICAVPSPATIFPSSTFTAVVQPTEVNATGTETVSVGPLPAGLTTTNTTVPLPASGGLLHFQAAASLATGNDTVSLIGRAGSVTASGTLALTVSANAPPSFTLTQPAPGEVAVPIGGGGSTQITALSPSPSQNVLFDITPSVSGLPAGTTSTIVPAVISPGQSFTVTLNAASGAPVTQNNPVTVLATPSVGGSAATTSFLADVTQPSGSLPNSRTDFTATGGTPYAAVYDRTHDLIFASDPAWNQVEVLSNKTHQVIKRIDISFPQGLDITQDGSTVWVGTQSQQVYAINTTTFATNRHLLPQFQFQPWTDSQLVALSDGTLLLTLQSGYGNGIGSYAIWNPASNSLNKANITLPIGGGSNGPVWRSGDGTRIYTYGVDSVNCGLVIYNVATQTSSTSTSDEVCGFYTVNHDGSRLVSENNAAVGLYDSSLNLIGPVPLTEANSPYYFSGSFIFSNEGSTLYEVANGRIATIDAASLQLIGIAPALNAQSQFWATQPASPSPFGVDGNGMLLDIQAFGIGFEDTSFFQNYGNNTIPAPSAVTLSAYSGPQSGGTQISPYGAFTLTPDVWFHGTRGTAQLNASSLTITSPPSSTPGPVNLKYVYPDGTQLFTPLVFSYGPTPEYALTSGASPTGGAPGTITGWGMPVDSSGGSVTIGSNAATITSKATQYLPFTGEPFPTTSLNFTVPNGSPGWADISVTTPAGTGILPKALFYANSVTEYTSPDKLTSVLFDASRKQVYLTATDHVDVFSLSSKQFTSSLYPPAIGKTKQFTGLALTPDSSKLLVTDLQDGSLGVISPDTPANSYVIPITPEYSPYNNCSDGPLYVAASADQKAFVVTGSLPALSCPAQGDLYVANLVTGTAARPTPAASSPCQFGLFSLPFFDATSADSTSDGSEVVISGQPAAPSCLYSAQTGQYKNLQFGGISTQVSGDGNVLAGNNAAGAAGGSDIFGDLQGNRINSLAQPVPLYPSPSAATQANLPLYQPVLNSSGSLQYIAYPNYFEIIDVLHGRLLIRFSLTETIQNTAAPIAVDPSGRYVFLITTNGLTVVDLGEAPLAVGHLSQAVVSAGSQITIRGSGFDSSLTASVGAQAAAVSVTDQSTLTLTVPSALSGPADLILSRADGSTYIFQSGIIVQ